MIQNKFKIGVALVSLIFFTTSYMQEVRSSASGGDGAGGGAPQAGKKSRVEASSPYLTTPSVLKSNIMSYLTNKEVARTSSTSHAQNNTASTELQERKRRAQALPCPDLNQAAIQSNPAIANRVNGNLILNPLVGANQYITVAGHNWLVRRVFVRVNGAAATLDNFLAANNFYPLRPLNPGVINDLQGRVCEYRAPAPAPVPAPGPVAVPPALAQEIALTIQSWILR